MQCMLKVCSLDNMLYSQDTYFHRDTIFTWDQSCSLPCHKTRFTWLPWEVNTVKHFDGAGVFKEEPPNVQGMKSGSGSLCVTRDLTDGSTIWKHMRGTSSQGSINSQLLRNKVHPEAVMYKYDCAWNVRVKCWQVCSWGPKEGQCRAWALEV